MITRNTHVTLKRGKSNLCECHLTSCSTHDVELHQVFLAKLAHPTIVASELKGDDKSQIALKIDVCLWSQFWHASHPYVYKQKKDVCALSCHKNMIFVLQFKPIAFFRNLRHSKYLFAVQFVYNWIIREYSSLKDILFALQFKVIESWRMFLAHGCSLSTTIECNWILKNHSRFSSVLQLNMIDYWKTSSLKELIFVLRLNAITSSRIFS